MISVVIPTYNSEKIIEKLIEEIRLNMNVNYELILINDCSLDGTKNKLKELEAKNKEIKVFHLENNIGQVGATLLGVKLAIGQIIITMDDDLQHNPKYIDMLINKINNGFDIAVAKWELDETLIRNISSFIFGNLSNLFNLKFSHFRNTAFRAIRKEKKDEFVSFFSSRFWIDPRRLSNCIVGQVNIPHEKQNFRAYSSFKSRLKLALSHLVFDSFMIQIFIIIFTFPYLYLMIFLVVLTCIIQIFIRSKLSKLRDRKSDSVYDQL